MLRALGARVRRDRRGHRAPASCAASTTASEVAAIPARLLTEEAPRYTVERRRARSPPGRADRVARGAAGRAERAQPARGSTSGTTTSSARGRSGARVSTRPCCACGRRSAASRSRSTARRRASGDPGPPARRPCSRRRATSPAPGGEPLALTDCLNFGNPEKAEIGWELAEAIEGIAEAAEALGDPGRLRERVALQRDGRARDPADAGHRLRRARARRPERCPGRGRRATRSCSWRRRRRTSRTRPS